MSCLPTLYEDYQEFLIDIDSYGNYISARQRSLDEVKELVYSDFQEQHSKPSLDYKRFELSKLVSEDYKVVYNNDLKLANSERLLDLTSNNSTELLDFNEIAEVAEQVEEMFSYQNAVTDSIREELIAKYELESGELLEPEEKEIAEGVFGTVDEDTTLTLSDDVIDNLGKEEIESDTDLEFNPLDSDEIEDTEDVDLEDEFDDEIESSDDFEEEEFDDDLDEDDSEEDFEEFDDTIGEEEDLDEEEEFDDDLDEDDSEEDFEEFDDTIGEEEDLDEDELLDDEIEEDINDDYIEDDFEDEEYEDNTEEEEETEVGLEEEEEPYEEEEESYEEEEEPNDFLDKVVKEVKSDKPVVSDTDNFFDSLDNIDFDIQEPELDVQPAQETVVKVHEPRAKPIQEVVREEEPTDIRKFLRKHPRCEYEFALQYFSKKQINDAIKIGKIVKRGNILKL